MISGWKLSYPLPKLFRIADGSVCGVCGDYAVGVSFKDWLDNGKIGDRPKLVDTSVIQMTKSGLVIHEDGGSFPAHSEFAAWGSGSPPAYGALYMGADARRAVEIAAMVDDGTGGMIEIMTLSAEG